MRLAHWMILALTLVINTAGVASPHVTLFVRHKVKDFAAWEKGYKSAEAKKLHKKYHRLSGTPFQEVDDPNDVTIMNEFRSLPEARNFAEAAELKSAMGKLGVVGAPTMWFTMKK